MPEKGAIHLKISPARQEKGHNNKCCGRHLHVDVLKKQQNKEAFIEKSFCTTVLFPCYDTIRLLLANLV